MKGDVSGHDGKTKRSGVALPIDDHLNILFPFYFSQHQASGTRNFSHFK
jgi:hypothetical protein